MLGLPPRPARACATAASPGQPGQPDQVGWRACAERCKRELALCETASQSKEVLAGRAPPVSESRPRPPPPVSSPRAPAPRARLQPNLFNPNT